VEDEAINKNLFQQEQGIVYLFNNSLLSPAEIALILVSAAWDIFEGKKMDIANNLLGSRNLPAYSPCLGTLGEQR
jgi:hypothetical protein